MKRQITTTSKLIFATILALSLLLSAAGCAASGNAGTPSATPGDSPVPDVSGDALTEDPADDNAAFLAEPASARVINIGYDGGLCQGVIAVAQSKGFFADEGLNTQLVKSENARDAIAGGKIDTSAGMIAVWLKPISNGVDIVFTVGLHTGCTSAVVLADSGITSFADVKGETIAITSGIGGQNQNIAFRFLAHDGLDQNDYKWADFPGDQALAVLERGEAKVFVGPDQLIEKWVQDGSVERIRSLDFDEDFKDEACCAMGISGAFFAENPITSEKISRAVYKASQWLQESDENKAEAAQLLLDEGHISGSAEYALDLLKLYRFGLSNELTEKSLYDSVDEYKQLGILSETIDADQLKAQIWKPLDYAQ
ncbi:MAG: ABC transporter substrate-binding protein [Oscillospiraceae bacterium]|jgi:NitT/TauT family transport system substrate-binding protein|nr:ABC transporter substrate-binding protein [Oscillospiraceae bacterium]